MKTLIVNYSDINGGAARAAYRLHHAMLSANIHSRMLVNDTASGDWTVHGPNSKSAKALGRIRSQLATPLRSLLCTDNPVIHSPSIFPSCLPEQINASNAEVAHLHWVQGEMVSIADIARIRKPIVWTLHDMWAFCGAEHYTTDYRWRDGYRHDNRPEHESGFDLNRWTWQRKRNHWRRPLQIVCPSQWLADCARSSALMADWPVVVIPNPIDTDRWQPIDQSLARQLLGLPQDCLLLLYGAMGGGSDPRKGVDLLLSALAQIANDPNLQSMQLVVFGQHRPKSLPQLGFPIHFTGHLNDDLSLRALYSAADVFVIPSRQDNLPNTGLEAHACGTPIVAFNVGGMTDIVDNRVTGAIAEPFQPGSLAEAIRWVLDDTERSRFLRSSARKRAQRLWNLTCVADQYAEVYRNVVRAYSNKK